MFKMPLRTDGPKGTYLHDSHFNQAKFRVSSILLSSARVLRFPGARLARLQFPRRYSYSPVGDFHLFLFHKQPFSQPSLRVKTRDARRVRIKSSLAIQTSPSATEKNLFQARSIVTRHCVSSVFLHPISVVRRPLSVFHCPTYRLQVAWARSCTYFRFNSGIQ